MEEISDEFDRRGEAIYEERLRTLLEPEFPGAAVAIHVDSGAYEVDPSWTLAVRKLRSRIPDGVFFVRFIGEPTPAEFALSARLSAGRKR